MFGTAVVLVRLARKRFGATVTGPSQALLERIVELAVLEELGEALLDCADGEAWLASENVERSRCWRRMS